MKKDPTPSAGEEQKEAHAERIFTKEELLFMKKYTLPDAYDPTNGKLDVKRSPSFIFSEEDKKQVEKLRFRDQLRKEEFAYLAPGVVHSLFTYYEGNERQERDNMFVKIGAGSNIQEIHEVDINPNQKINIEIGVGSSIAHGVKIKVGNSRPEAVNITIGSRTFIGINTKFYGGVSIGSDVAVGFNVTIMDRVKVGDNVIIGDGATICEGVIIPSNCVVLGGTNVTAKSMNQISTVTQHLNEQKKGMIHTEHGIIKYTSKEELSSLGNMYDFLYSFNEKVTSENLTFPPLNKLLMQYHKVKGEDGEKENKVRHDKSAEGNVSFIYVYYPRNIHEFLEHYFHEAQKKEKDENYEIEVYKGEFTDIDIDHKTFFNGGTVRFYGDTYIHDSEVGRDVIFRGDEGGTFDIQHSVVGYKNVFHASGVKKVEYSTLGAYNVIHGRTLLNSVTTKEKVLFHNVHAKNVYVGDHTSIVEATVKNAEIGAFCGITGHADSKKSEQKNIREGVLLLGASLGENVHIRYRTEIKGARQEHTKKKNLFIGKNTRIGYEVRIEGDEKCTSIGENVDIGNMSKIIRCKKIGDFVFIGSNVRLENIKNIPSKCFIPDGIVCESDEAFQKLMKEGVVKKWE